MANRLIDTQVRPRGVRVLRLVADGVELAIAVVAVESALAISGAVRAALDVGPLAITSHATPGHAPGGTSWSWRSCEGGRCVTFVYADSVSAVSSDSYRFSDHKRYVAAFKDSLNKIGRMQCSLLVTPHPGASNLYDRLAGKAPLIDGGACREYARRGE